MQMTWARDYSRGHLSPVLVNQLADSSHRLCCREQIIVLAVRMSLRTTYLLKNVFLLIFLVMDITLNTIIDSNSEFPMDLILMG